MLQSCYHIEVAFLLFWETLVLLHKSFIFTFTCIFAFVIIDKIKRISKCPGKSRGNKNINFFFSAIYSSSVN